MKNMVWYWVRQELLQVSDRNGSARLFIWTSRGFGNMIPHCIWAESNKRGTFRIRSPLCRIAHYTHSSPERHMVRCWRKSLKAKWEPQVSGQLSGESGTCTRSVHNQLNSLSTGVSYLNHITAMSLILWMVHHEALSDCFHVGHDVLLISSRHVCTLLEAALPWHRRN